MRSVVFRRLYFVWSSAAALAFAVSARAVTPLDPVDGCVAELIAGTVAPRKASELDAWLSIPPISGATRKWDAHLISKTKSPWLNRRVQLAMRTPIQLFELKKFVSSLEGRVESIQLEQTQKAGDTITLRVVNLRDDSGLLHPVPMAAVESISVWGSRAMQTDFIERYPRLLPRTPATLQKIQLRRVAMLLRTGAFGEQRIVEGTWENPVLGESAGILNLNDGSRLPVLPSSILAIAFL